MRDRKVGLSLIGACALLLAMALPAGAQVQNAQGIQGQGADLSVDQRILGKDVTTQQGQKLGEIEDVIVSRQGRVWHYLVHVANSAKTVALNPDELRIIGQSFIFNGSRADLENMEGVNPDWGSYGYYGYNPGFQGYSPPAPGQSPYSLPSSEGYGAGYSAGAGGPGLMGERQGSSGQGDQPYPRREYYGAGAAQQRPTRATPSMSADILLGAQLFDNQNRSIGEMEDLLLNPQTRRISYAVARVGDREVLVPFSRLRIMGEDSVMFRGTEDQLRRMREVYPGQGGRM